MGRSRSRSIKQPKKPLSVRIAEQIMPAAQVARGDYEVRDVANYNEADQRHMVRSGERKTIRRTTKIDQLLKRGIINDREALACEWYQSTYENEYETRVRIADWGGTGGSSDRAYGHWPAGTPLDNAESLYRFARQGIAAPFLPLFERVVIHGRPLGKLAITFRHAARQLLSHIEGKVAL